MKHYKSWARYGCLTVVLATMIGCGSKAYEGQQRAEVSGAISLNGSPVQQGSINLSPIGHEGRSASASIEAGKYLITEDQGPNMGKYRVEIYAFEPKQGTSADSDAGMPQVAPREFNVESTLELEVDSEKVAKDFTL